MGSERNAYNYKTSYNLYLQVAFQHVLNGEISYDHTNVFFLYAIWQSMIKPQNISSLTDIHKRNKWLISRLTHRSRKLSFRFYAAVILTLTSAHLLRWLTNYSSVNITNCDRWMFILQIKNLWIMESHFICIARSFISSYLLRPTDRLSIFIWIRNMDVTYSPLLIRFLKQFFSKSSRFLSQKTYCFIYTNILMWRI